MIGSTDRKTHRRAVTLIEAVLFIAIALGLIIGGLVFFQQASTAHRTQEYVRLITAIEAEAKASYRVNKSSIGLGELIASGSIPSRYISEDGQSIVGPDNNAIGGGIESGSTGSDWFFVTLDDVPAAICARIAAVERDGSGPVINNITFMHVRSMLYETEDTDICDEFSPPPCTTATSTALVQTDLHPNPGGWGPFQFSLSPSEAAAACREAGDLGNGKVFMNFGTGTF
jgi:hypothetical protein